MQKQILEEREGGFSRKPVVSSVQKRFELSAYKQLRRSKPKSGETKPSRSPVGVITTPVAVDLVTAVENQAYCRAVVETAAAVGAAKTATQAAEDSLMTELAATAVEPRPRSPLGGRAGCARSNSIMSVTAPNRSAWVWREGPLNNQVRKDGARGDGGRHAWQNVNGRRLPDVLRCGSRGINHP